MSSASNLAAGVLTDTGTYLDKIIANTLIEVENRKRFTSDLVPHPQPPQDFVAALHKDTVALIAEVKHASPSKGVLIEPFDPVALATVYAANSASAISVLTDEKFFRGNLADLGAVRKAVHLPILRKDFVIDAFQIEEARMVGADAILLIVGVLDDAKLADLYAISVEHGLTALVEVHDAGELDRALKLKPRLIGINARDLRTFHTDLNTIRQLAARVPSNVTFVAESGIHTAADVEAMAAVGARAVLVGESLITATDCAAKVRELSGVKFKR
ncbi:MAG: indole-3-glycerol phosphate synthase TrpC [Aggregatilineales bacterium]